LVLGKVADLWNISMIFDILAFLPIIAFILTLFIHEPQRKETLTAHT
jgi:MFS transporter, FSR family, fosmidomycin resistance protein